MDNIHCYLGNTVIDGERKRGWFCGEFINPESICNDKVIETKWGIHKIGECCDWKSSTKSKTMAILLNGSFLIELRNSSYERRYELNNEGDYLVWDENYQHRWKAISNSKIITIRWTLT